ncbi:transposase [Pseudomonas silensiensis]|uniref:transposase n=1 Tax=Pseudomonas silensiensis TaxID=2991049 RepID=UPI003D1C089F
MRHRSSYLKPFKAQVVQECLQPVATLSSVAISHGINANVIRKWLPLYRCAYRWVTSMSKARAAG